MIYEAYIRICVGAVLEPDATAGLVARFHQSLGLDAACSLAEVHEALRETAPKHKLHQPDRMRYELAFEAFVDGYWDVDCAIGGLTDGGVDPVRGYVLVGVRIEDIESVGRDDMPALSGRPRWLRKGDLTAGSDLSRELGPDAYKPFTHAGRMYQRAAKEIMADTIKRTQRLPISKQHDPDWALVKWLVRQSP